MFGRCRGTIRRPRQAQLGLTSTWDYAMPISTFLLNQVVYLQLKMVLKRLSALA